MTKPKATSDDLEILSNEELIARLRVSLGGLQGVATSHDEKIDAEILLAEQALRRAIKLLKSA